MNLKALAKYRRIAIQCHDIPDADTICSGFAIQEYLKSLGADSEICYGGTAVITKPSLLMMQEMFGISITYAKYLHPETDLLITVDCQRGAGNVFKFELPGNARIVVLDHHRSEIPENEDTVIRPNLASCATLVWDLLNKEGYEMSRKARNALYYGLYTDTNGLSELRHPLDRDLAELPNDAGLIRKLKNAAITIDELDIVGDALSGREIIGNIGVFKARPCDPNLLGFTSDIAQQVAKLDCCIVYCTQPHGMKLSIRSSVREIMASEIAGFICRDIGSGGGNVEKAGGFISNAKLAEVFGDVTPEDYLNSRVNCYRDYYDLVYAGENDVDFKSMSMYKKFPREVGYSPSIDIFPSRTKITIRTLEGDLDTVTGEDIYLMIGILGEVYPIKRERFESTYIALDKPYRQETEYQPAVINRNSGDRASVLPFARACIPKENKIVLRAEELKKDTKVFTNWDTEKYYLGQKGDFLAAVEGNYDDCYVVRRDVFFETYEKIGM